MDVTCFTPLALWFMPSLCTLQALFRPVSMAAPDLALICEIMLMSEGFQQSKLLSRKFIILYKLCEDLLSKVGAALQIAADAQLLIEGKRAFFRQSSMPRTCAPVPLLCSPVTMTGSCVPSRRPCMWQAA